jgi:cyclopropane-fatty-acyl-phospholipid synthase
MTGSFALEDKSVDRWGVLDRIARRVLTKRMGRLSRGQITLIDSAETIQLGAEDDLQTTVHVRRPRFFREAVMGGTNGVAASYLRGDWECDNLTNLFRIFVRNLEASDRIDGGLARLAGIGHRIYHWCRANSFAGSRRNIGAHYDLGNDFFQLWLDDTLAYSCGIFTSPQASLASASEEKFDRVCRKLQLRRSDHVLEIGTGWGGFAMHAANEYGCRVTTTTISEQQYLAAKQRIDRARLADRVSLLQQDYRQLTGQFDKLVSIEMIEAVGHKYYDQYFRQCGQLLRPDGSFVLQAIVMPERRYEEHLRCVDFIQRFIFPGGCLPSIAALLESAGRVSDLRLVHAARRSSPTRLLRAIYSAVELLFVLL